jgi:hypothetical protein
MSTIQPQVTGRKLPTRLVCERYGVSSRTVARWGADPNFPKPILINGRKYYEEDLLTAYDRAQAVGRLAKPPQFAPSSETEAAQ